MEKKEKLTEEFIMKINNLYHEFGKTNLYASIQKKVYKERIYNELERIKDLIDEFIEEQLKEEKTKKASEK